MTNETPKHKGLFNSIKSHFYVIIAKIVKKENLVETINARLLEKYKNEKIVKRKFNNQGLIVQINSHYILHNKNALKSERLTKYYIDYTYILNKALSILNNQWVVGITLLLLGTML